MRRLVLVAVTCVVLAGVLYVRAQLHYCDNGARQGRSGDSCSILGRFVESKL